MLNYDQIYQETLKISAERAKWLDNLSVLSELSTEKYYRILRNLCVDGYVAQTKINDHLGFISVPETGLREFVQFLVNFSIQNTQNLETCLGLLPSISCGPSNIKFVMMLSHNIINHSYELKLKFLYTCGDLIRAFLTHQGLKDDEFEWLYFFLIKIIPGNLEALTRILDSDASHLYEIICTSFEESYCGKRCLIQSDDTAWISFKLEDCAFISNHFAFLKEVTNTPLLNLLNYVSREATFIPDIKNILFSSQAFQTCVDMLSLDLQAGIRVKLLQIITNTLEDNQEAASYLENHIYIILKSSELDMQNLMCREWVVLIIRILTQLKPGIEEKIQEIRHRIK